MSKSFCVVSTGKLIRQAIQEFQLTNIFIILHIDPFGFSTALEEIRFQVGEMELKLTSFGVC